MDSTPSDVGRTVESFQTVVDVAGVPIYTLDSDGQFTYVNTALTTAAGYDRSSLVGEHVSVLLCEDDVERCRRAIRELLETGRKTCEIAVSARSASDRRLTADLSISLLPLDSGFRGTVGVVRDLSPEGSE
ncbi:PAS domain S-box protein [Halorientalis salina]|uniref:PAS domain S-box protein n=1 Tax=Halorientalis salina TaxID=2932266 RepID=UPI0010AD4E2B|nr:PAS domain S-box protein [Halorientalis salina]